MSMEENKSENLEIFSFFNTQKKRDFVEQIFNFTKSNLLKQVEQQPLFKRTENILTNVEQNYKDLVSYYYVEPELLNNSPYGNINFEYLRLSFKELPKIKTQRINEQILFISIPKNLQIELEIIPLIRFLSRIEGYLGAIYTDASKYHYNGTKRKNEGIIPNIRKLENIILKILTNGNDYPNMFEELIGLYLSRFEDKTFEKKDGVLSRIILSNVAEEFKLRCIEHLQFTDSILQLLEENLSEKIELILTKKLPKKLIKLLKESIPDLKLEKVKTELSKEFENEISNKTRMIDKLSKIVVRVRKGTFSKRCKAPKGYIAVVCQSVADGSSTQIQVLSGQDPFEVKLVRTSRDIREIYPLGTFFVCWIAKNQVKKKDNELGFYISHSNTLLPIFFNY